MHSGSYDTDSIVDRKEDMQETEVKISRLSSMSMKYVIDDGHQLRCCKGRHMDYQRENMTMVSIKGMQRVKYSCISCKTLLHACCP